MPHLAVLCAVAAPAATAVVKRPVAAYVERVYDEGNFGGLGI